MVQVQIGPITDLKQVTKFLGLSFLICQVGIQSSALLCWTELLSVKTLSEFRCWVRGICLADGPGVGAGSALLRHPIHSL